MKKSILLLLVVALSSFGAAVGDIAAGMDDVLQWASKEYNQHYPWSFVKKNATLVLKFDLNQEGRVSDVEVPKNDELPLEIQEKVVSKVQGMRFSHKVGEPNVFTYTFSFQSPYWDWKRGLIGAGAVVLLLIAVTALSPGCCVGD